jgi:hypothetical protein
MKRCECITILGGVAGRGKGATGGSVGGASEFGKGDCILPAMADEQAVSAGLSFHSGNRSSHRLSNCRHRGLFT